MFRVEDLVFGVENPFPRSVRIPGRATPLGRSRYQTSEIPIPSEFPTELPTHRVQPNGEAFLRNAEKAAMEI